MYILGYLAATIVSASYIPETILIIQSRDTESFSLYFLIIKVIGLILLVYYSIIVKHWPFIILNLFILLNMLIYLVVKIRNMIKYKEVAHRFHHPERNKNVR